MKYNFVQQADVFVIMYSVTSKSSFDAIKEELELIYRMKDRGDVSIIIVGNKIDLKDEREVTREEGEKYAKLHKGVLFEETSAKTGENVTEVLDQVILNYFENARRIAGLQPKDEGHYVAPPEVQDPTPSLVGSSVKRAR
mmetsp:Transcript_36159/g.56639  ORF Transcript_36159/g.56639 Transcript_36159/m.56639 type:complete len:140 (-) Transcript_36159:28-447(-)|eukprot:CAMPEP_0201540288 /NCGR_PEP_ID=MMETSP0161_2-20130828/70865_1 /ASSEMBLY_ACC=CAM_ASM_000251 /TAXON_ID=180227 /ORGANISM="Neoparamoeba aestuarina, Strain SoJaBio B1-5/56/2" /LENGTH=139 /DNA_ID=CAMNT_0047947747 /DNA_START=495 /DNA_END=917 /DNA_ORIENTATION=-